MWMSHVTHIGRLRCKSRCTYVCVWHGSCDIFVTWLNQYVWHDSLIFLAVQQLLHSQETVSRIDKITGLFCRIASLLQVSFAKETYNLIDPTNCSHLIAVICDMTHWYVWYDSLICVTWLSHIHMRAAQPLNSCCTANISESCHTAVGSAAKPELLQDSFNVCVTWLIQNVQHDSLLRRCLAICTCDMTHSICVTWLIQYVWRHSLNICETWLNQCVWHDSFNLCDMTHSYVRHDSSCQRSRDCDPGTSHVTHIEWVMSHILNESCHTYWMSHVIHIEWVTSHTLDESCHTHWRSHVTHIEWVMSRIYWMSHVTHIEWVMSHILNESCYTYWMSHVTQIEWVMSYILNESLHIHWMSHVTHIERVTSHTLNESCHAYIEWVMSHILNESCHTY